MVFPFISFFWIPVVPSYEPAGKDNGLLPSSNESSFNEEHPDNIDTPKASTFPGIIRDSSLEQYENAPLPIISRPSPKAMCSVPEQFWKALSRINMILGKDTSLKVLQSLKASDPILTTELRGDTDSKFEHPVKSFGELLKSLS